MEVAVVRQFLTFFQEFLDLCQSETWPNHDTTYNELKHAFITSQHIEKCMEKLHRKNLINEFLISLNEKANMPASFFKSCLSNPPKYILKKIIVSDVKPLKIELSFGIFTELFSEQSLETSLADIMVEAASEQTLIKHLPTLPKEDIMNLKSKLLLYEIEHTSEGSLFEMLQNSDETNIEILITCILNRDPLLCNTVNIVKTTFSNVMLSKSKESQNFWKRLISVDECLLGKLFMEHNCLLKLFVKALVDNSKLLRENMSSEYFYIDLTYSDIVGVVAKLCNNQCLKYDFFEAIKDHQTDLLFWQNMLSLDTV